MKSLSLMPKSIKARGIWLIAIPLAIELLMVVILINLQRGYQEKLSTEQQACDIVARANELWLDFSEGMAKYGDYGIFGGPERPDSLRADLQRQYEELLPLLANQQHLARIVTGAQKRMNQCLDFSTVFRRVKDAKTPEEKIEALKADSEVFSKLQVPIRRFDEKLVEFEKEETLFRSEAANEVEEKERQINLVLLFMVALSIVAGFSLFVLFTGAILKRINLLIDNTERFRKGQELEKEFSGGDELDSLDSAFHKMAEEISEAQKLKQQMVATISHDVRTPLASISMYLELLTMGTLPSTAGELEDGAVAAEQDVNEVVGLITILLDIEKVQAGRMEIAPQTVPARDLVMEAVDKYNDTVPGDRFEIAVPQVDLTMAADRDRIVQTLEILIKNAMALSTESKIEIAIDSSSNGRETTISIRAKGSSLSADLLESAMSGDTQTPLGSRALGLPLCQMIARSHEGAAGIAIVDNEDMFWLRLPSSQPT